MKKEKIIANAKAELMKFQIVAKMESYQSRGIFTSEALLIISIARMLNVKFIVESGRARGYSTKIFAEFFKNDSKVKIISIDFDTNSKDAKYSEEQLRDYKNVSLIYGDANNLIADYVKEDCLVFIDGPKGDEALLLAAKLIKYSHVKAICIHDLHKNTFHRNICEILFTEVFFSDDAEFVKEFEFLDSGCWEKLKVIGESPYLRKGEKNLSYASTVAVIFSNAHPINERILENYKEYYLRNNQLVINKFLKQCLLRCPIIANPVYKIFSFIKRILALTK
jgi:hypothetical protein